MMLGKYRLIEMEQNPAGDPGRVGDSCAETNRLHHLEAMTYHFKLSALPSHASDLVLDSYLHFRTDKGYVRHPDSIWREDDYSGDQWLPMFLTLFAFNLEPQYYEMAKRLKENQWRYGNGDLIHPTAWAAVRRAAGAVSWMSDAWILFQILAMVLIPYRWNDETKWFEKAKHSSADWLNWVHLIFLCERTGHSWTSRLAKKLVSGSTVMQKISHYYLSKPEPNCEWLLDLYRPVVMRTFG